MIEIIQSLLEKIPVMLRNVRQQNYAVALKEASEMILELDSLLKGLSQEKELQTELENSFIKILQAQEDKDYILMADYYELLLMPFLSALQEQLLLAEKDRQQEAEGSCYYSSGKSLLQKRYPKLAEKLPEIPDKEAWSKKGYELEKTSSGAYTLSARAEGKRYYFHSNGNPGWEATQLASYWYEVEKRSYVIYGLGLGYPILSLAEQDSSIQIWIYESDLTIVEIALAYGVLTELLKQDRIHIILDSLGERLQREVRKQDVEFLIYYPSIRIIKEETFRKWLELQFIQYQSMKSQMLRLKQNFRENKVLDCDGISELIKEEKRKRFFIISAGPSLDDNYLELRKKKSDDVIIATGPVLKKLILAGIQPDYVVISESSEKYRKRLEGLEEIKAPLLFLSTASSRYVQDYPGRKYLLCQHGFEAAERLAEEKGWPLIETGGSVAIVALSVAIQLGASEIIFVGQDLAYSKNKRHAADTSGTELSTEKGFAYEEKDIYGNVVQVPQNLELFRKRIEEIVAQNSQIHFQNATEGGVAIQGVVNVCLKNMFV